MNRCGPQRAAELAEALAAVRAEIAAAAKKAGRKEPTLVAVSKTRPAADILAAYDQGQRHFGENYVGELLEKARELPADIKWHFIGHLQTNKAKQLLAGVPGLHRLETVDSERLAAALQKHAADRPEPLGVFIQVNTSGEATKAGVAPAEAPRLAAFIAAQCPQLALRGLMTIGAPAATSAGSDFERLSHVQDALGGALAVPELSMGMSDDFCDAISHGSTSVRVGSRIFGSRAPSG